MLRSWMLVFSVVLFAACSSESANHSPSPQAPLTPVNWTGNASTALQDVDEKANALAQSEYESVDLEFKKAIAELRSLIAAVDSKDDKIRLLATRNPAPEFAKRFMEIAKKHSGTKAGLNAVLFAVQRTKGDQKNEAMNLLIDSYSDQVDLVKVAQSLKGEVPSQDVENWLQAMIEKVDSESEKSAITVTFAKYVGQIPYFQRTLAVNPAILKRYSAAQLDYINSTRTQAQNDHLAGMLQSVIDNSDQSRMETVAKKELYDLQNLQVGMVAPEIDGKDFDDIPFKLSDYRGKVVMLDFWGHWCPPCRAMYGHEQTITQILADKPFVLLGVNSDRNKEVAVDALRNEGLSWRHFWNGPQGRNGPIASQWNIEGWPTVYLIDQDGVIRYKGVLGADLDRGIEKLMAEIGHEVEISE